MMDGGRTVRLGLIVFGFVALGLLFAVWSIKHEVARTVIFMIVATSILTPLAETISDRFSRLRTTRGRHKDH